MKTTSPHSAAGFTLVEVLVAMSILLILLSLIGVLFTQTSAAVSLGTANSDLLNGARAFHDQLQRDADTMLGPLGSTGTNGFLVILNKKITTTRTQPDGSVKSEDIRSDQLIFIRDATGLSPMTPGATDTFANQATAPYARVWWGHAQRMNLNGTDTNTALGTGINTFANRWILGRQALLLAGSTLGLTTAIPANAIYAYPQTLADGGTRYNDIVVNVDSPNNSLYMGTTDVSNMSLTGTGTGNPTGIIGNTASDTNYPLHAGLLEATYKTRAYAYTYGAERLRVNPRPTNTDSSSINFTSAEIAQMHPFFMANVSDFVVEFAADVNNNGLVDTNTAGGSDVGGNIIWYDGYHAGVVGWTPYDGSPQIAASGDMPNADRAFVWRHDVAGNWWPYLIRVRYRAHDYAGKIAGDNNTPGKWFELIFKVPRP